MTAQAHDLFEWNDRDHLLVGIDGDRLFDPTEHGLVTRPTTTANWRGWVARYAIRDDRLTLMELHDVGLDIGPEELPPTVGGVVPSTDGRYVYRYDGLNMPLTFTGSVLIAHGFIQSLYRHMGFHPAWKFEESWELMFDRGHLTGTKELTADMRARRKKIQRGREEDPDDPRREGWIAKTFRLDFGRSKGH